MSTSTAHHPLRASLWRHLLLVLALGSLVRILLIVLFNANQALSLQATIFAIGVGADLLVAAVCCALALLAIRVGRRTALCVIALLAFISLLVCVAELFYWNEFQSRLDRLVFHYLSYPQEVLTFLEDQFFLSLYAIPFLVLVWLVYRWLSAPVRRASPNWHNAAPNSSMQVAASFVAAVVLGLLLINLPLPQSRVAEQLASNGYIGVVRAALTNEARWQGLYPEPQTTRPLPNLQPQRQWQTPPKHLVLIIEESFAGRTWQDPTLRAKFLPHFSALAARSWSFSNLFATGSRTTRGMEALLNGVPPLPGVSTTQRPRPERLPSLPRALANNGWHTAFIYAGWPDFSDLSAYWRAIGFAETTNRGDFDPSAGDFETSWGYADEVLFKRLITEMNTHTAAHEQVFAASLTVSHHRPFDYPAGRVSFPADERRSEYAMAYADWALGQFMAEAAKSDWYQDTLFVIAGDHGARFHGHASIPVNSYRVPLLIYSPGRTQPRELSNLGSLMEVPGTLLDLLEVADSEGFFGTHLLDDTQALVPVEHDYDIGLINRDGVTVLKRGAASEAWHWQDPEQLAPGPVDPQQVETAAHLFKEAHERYFNN